MRIEDRNSIYRRLIKLMPVKNEYKGICYYLYQIIPDINIYLHPDGFFKENFPELINQRPKEIQRGHTHMNGYWWSITDVFWEIRKEVVNNAIFSTDDFSHLIEEIENEQIATEAVMSQFS